MIGKKDYANTIEMQLLKKEKASLESKVFKQHQEHIALQEKLHVLEKEHLSLKDLIDKAEDSGNIIRMKPEEIKLRSNIRDDYEFEEIENLALDIVINSQLQPVLLTSDNYLISGHRRYFALKLIQETPDKLKLPEAKEGKVVSFPKTIVAYHLERANSEISELELQELQYAENNERRALDNFQLSRMYNRYMELGLGQKDLVQKFKKTKGMISSIVALKKIDPVLVHWLKEFQVFAWSKERYFVEVKGDFSETRQQFYHNHKGIIGWKPLYEMAKQSSLKEQKMVFLELFGNRLSDEEKNSEYFSDTNKKVTSIPVNQKITQNVLKHSQSIETLLKGYKSKNPEHLEKLSQVKKYLAEINSVLKSF